MALCSAHGLFENFYLGKVISLASQCNLAEVAQKTGQIVTYAVEAEGEVPLQSNLPPSYANTV